MSSSLSYSSIVVLLTGVDGWVFGSAVTLAGSLTIILSSGWVDLSVNQLSKVNTCSGWGAATFAVVTECDLCFSWACLATSFQVISLHAYSTCRSANGSTTCLASSKVSQAFSLSQHASLDYSMPCLSGGHFLSAHRCIHPFTLLSLWNSALVRVLNQSDTVSMCQNCCLKTDASSLGEIFFIQCKNLHHVDSVCC